MRDDTALHSLSRDERMLLMRFLCTFAWADGQVRAEERALVMRYAEKLGLDDAAANEVRAWLEEPPPPESVDPKLVPERHRLAFVHAIESIVSVDGDIAPAERERLIRLASLFRPSRET